ncbi:hypothetical protein [Streptomyces sp. NPDC001546]|uniref:hypothetical protein n=1 Tax=Streptomyces sp. NPDC001546 TaxID=3364585 RepID=UPI0036B19166
MAADKTTDARTAYLEGRSIAALAGRGIGAVTDEGGVIPSRGRFYAWSAMFGPRGFHTTQADAVARVVAAWLNTGPGAQGLMTSTGTVHANRTTATGLAPSCMTDCAAQGLRILLRTGQAVTCRHCPNA